MSEPEVMEVDPTLVNGGDKHDDISHTQEPQVKQPIEPVNGLDQNGLEEPDEDNIPINGDINAQNDLIDNGDVNAQNDLIDNDLIDEEGGGEGEIVLPPPPEDMSGFPPPLNQQDVDIFEPEEANLEPDSNIGEVDNEIVEDDVMGESIEGIPQVDNIEVKPVVDDVSEEELVSDGDLEQQHSVPQPPQLIDFGGEPNTSDDVQVCDNNILDSPVPDEGQAGLAHELVPEPVMAAPEPEIVAPEPPVVVLEPEPEPLPVDPEPPMPSPEPEIVAPEPPVVAPEPKPVEDEPPVVPPEINAPEPEIVAPEPEKVDPEPVAPVYVEPELPEPEPFQQPVEVQEQEPEDKTVVVEAVVEQEPPAEPVNEVIPPVVSEEVSQVAEQPRVEEFNQEENSRHVENDYIKPEPVVEQPPDIIAQTTEEPHEVKEEAPPPPPPPLVDETPPPPPPLDDSIQLKRDSRRSGEVTPKKESPVEPPVVHVPEPTPVVHVPEPTPIAVVAPVMKTEEKVVKPEPPRQAAPAVVAPVVAVEDNKEGIDEGQGSIPVSPVSSPARSEGAGSEGALSEPQELASPKVSQKINKKNFKNKIKFHVDLVEASLKQLNFLSSVNKQTSLQEEWLYKQAIRRYEAFWLPLASEHKKEHLAAPLDIEWVWHCHMLAPLFYETDCVSLVGKVVDHKLYSEKERTKALEKSRKYWTAKYPNEPFEIELVYKEKSEVVEAKTEDNTTQESDSKDENIPYVEEGTSETDPKDNQEEVTADGGEVTEGDKKTEEPASTEETEKDGQDEEPKPDNEPKPEQEPAKQEPAKQEPAAPAVPPAEEYIQKSSYDIFSAIGRQRVFFYQVSLPHYHDKLFLKSALKRYQKLLFLKHQNPTEFLVPCYDIDLIWHAHQLHPVAYKKDTSKVLGQMLNHNDSVNDRTPGSKLVRADAKTRDLWKTLFEDTFASFGAMFRGDPPVLCERMSLIQPEETYAFSTKKATINLDKFQIEGLPEAVNKYNVKVVYGASEKEGPLIKSFRGNKKKVEFENAKKGLAHFVFDTKEYDRLKFNMSQQVGFACAGHDEDIGEQMFNLLPVVEAIPKRKTDASTITDTVTIDEEQNLKATFSATVETPKQGPTMLFLKNGTYETRFCIMPEHVVQMWGPIPLPRLPAGRDNACVVASHKFVNHTGEVTFTCRFIHSLPLLMSAVQVFYHDRMAAVAHLVGSDQLPLPEQLSDTKKNFSLNAKEGQRGIVIKNRTGDWGLLRGQWIGFRKGAPATAASKGRKAKKAVAWSPGTLSVSFYKLSTGTWQHISLNYLQNDYKFNIQESNVDLKTGVIQVDSTSNEVAENVALAFAVSLLHVLCQPRHKPTPPPVAPKPAVPKTPPPVEAKTKEGDEVEGVAAPEGTPEVGQEEKGTEKEETPKSPAKVKEVPATPKKVVELPPIPSADLAFVVAAGYRVETPTNQYIKNAHGENACAGCLALGIDVGVGYLGDMAAEATAGVETVEAAENVAELGEADVEAGGDAEGAEGGDEHDMEMDGDAGETAGDAGGDGGGDAAFCGGCGGCGA